MSSIMNDQPPPPIYKLFVSRKLDTWYQLTKHEQIELIKKLDEAFGRARGKRPILLDTSWSSDKWYKAGVEVFPDHDALRGYMRDLKSIEWARYCESRNILGTEYDPTFDLKEEG
jgi:hypothetical protein